MLKATLTAMPFTPGGIKAYVRKKRGSKEMDPEEDGTVLARGLKTHLMIATQPVSSHFTPVMLCALLVLVLIVRNTLLCP